MKHPEILLLPLLMFADCFLTMLGSIEREKRHALHFKIEDYEFNPLWQRAIRKRKRINLRHILSVIDDPDLSRSADRSHPMAIAAVAGCSVSPSSYALT